MFRSPLKRAIARGLNPGGDLVQELSDLGDYTIRSRNDAWAICKALATLPEPPPVKYSIQSRLWKLASLFLDVESVDVPAFKVLYVHGLSHLVRIFDALVDHVDDDLADDLLFVLRVLAAYGSQEGADRVVESARRPLKPDSFMWHPLMAEIARDPENRDHVFRALGESMPTQFVAVALLDAANSASLDGELERHPFDSPGGLRQISAWLQDSNPRNYSYANSATGALAFLTNPLRDELLSLALDHTDVGVQMEAAWVAARLGREAGIKILARYCLDLHRSARARQYLGEFGLEDRIPAECREPTFQAKAEFAEWLAHPNELGRPPDELELVDHRELAWPPERDKKPFWLLKFVARDTTGLDDDQVDCGLVGSVTFCLFSTQNEQRPPEDAYAVHCFWEMECADLIKRADVTDPQEYVGMLGQWQGGHLENVKFRYLAELSPKLQYPATLVALVSARLAGEEGWIVLDGPRSAWYPQSEMPRDQSPHYVLSIHIGSRLLGFTGQPDRKKYLAQQRPPRDPAQVVAAYERFLSEAETGPGERRKELLVDNRGPLSRHFPTYVEALEKTSGITQTEAVIQTYGRLLKCVQASHSLIGDKAYDSFTPLGENASRYADALIAQGRKQDVLRLIDMFKPHWDHNLGYRMIASFAFKAGDLKTAETFCARLRQSLEEWYRAEEMSILAEIWHGQGRVGDARQLLIDCMLQIIPRATYPGDEEYWESDFQKHRATFLRLFPEEGNVTLSSLGIPATTLR